MEHPRQQRRPQMLYLLDSAHIGESIEEKTVAKQRKKSKGQRWCCAVCGTYVTQESYLVHIDGTFEHYKMNPQGQAFQFRSFIQAEGCARVGQPTEENTWYTGYFWQFAHCARCQTQLGWYFTGPKPFFGLIKQQLVRCPDDNSL
jgi:hypothetical protein